MPAVMRLHMGTKWFNVTGADPGFTWSVRPCQSQLTRALVGHKCLSWLGEECKQVITRGSDSTMTNNSVESEKVTNDELKKLLESEKATNDELKASE